MNAGIDARLVIGAVKAPSAHRYPSKQLAALQAAARGMLNQAADGRGPATLLGEDGDLAVYVDPPRYQRSRLRALRDVRTRRLRVIGSVRACFLLTLALLLTGKNGPRVHRCPGVDCGNVFVGRGMFCSKRCRMRVYMRYQRTGTTARYQRAYGH